jgi:dTDP-4-amino-4,6-dideoxygalactose transaminase
MDSYDIILEFEKKIAEYTGSEYAVSVDSGTNGMFLSLLYLKSIGELKQADKITIPKRTFLSVPMAITNAGMQPIFEDIEWSGGYQLKPTRVYDSAVRLKKGMYIPNSLMILSFQYKKHIPIGRGGMVLTNDKEIVDWLKQMRFNGKHEGVSRWNDKFEVIGWDMYMTPEQAARGLLLFYNVKDDNIDLGSYKDYPDLSTQEIFK